MPGGSEVLVVPCTMKTAQQAALHVTVCVPKGGGLGPPISLKAFTAAKPVAEELAQATGEEAALAKTTKKDSSSTK